MNEWMHEHGSPFIPPKQPPPPSKSKIPVIDPIAKADYPWKDFPEMACFICYWKYVVVADETHVVHQWRNLVLLIIGVPLFIGTACVSYAVYRATLLRGPTHHVPPPIFRRRGVDVADGDMVGEDQAVAMAKRLAGACKIRTISLEPGKQQFNEFLHLHEYLQSHYPLLHKCEYITYEVVNKYSLLYTVNGTADSKNTLPYLLCSHLDVVPADPATWEEPPYGGRIVHHNVHTYIYGRGALDDKCGVLGILEALEHVVKTGNRLKRTFYIAFGHDEEIGGAEGARIIAATLKARGVKRLDFLIDEGLPMTRGVIPGTGNKLVSVIGVTEKGAVTVELNVTGISSHASFPPNETAIGILSRAVSRLEMYPQPSKFCQGPEGRTFKDLATHCSFFFKVIYHNLWLFSRLMAQFMSWSPVTNAQVRTTTAITLFHGGVKDDVVPPSATATVSLRIHPAQTVTQAVNVIRSIVKDKRVDIREVPGTAREAHPVSPSGRYDMPYQLIVVSLNQVFPGVAVVPGVFMGSTDTRWYLDLTRNVYRMFPFTILPKDLSRIHGDNERLEIGCYHKFVNFYYRLMRNADLLIDQPTAARLVEHRSGTS